jgi:hypothetical protein
MSRFGWVRVYIPTIDIHKRDRTLIFREWDKYVDSESGSEIIRKGAAVLVVPLVFDVSKRII